jgi:ubiquinone/menaquinone biosynthesis C-methylase UbiE
MDFDLAAKILHSNVKVHRIEAAIYDLIHPEIFGWFEQRKTIRDIDLIGQRMPKSQPVTVLDVGCGTGNLTLKFAERGYAVHAVDISPEMIGRLEAKIEPEISSQIRFTVSDAASFFLNKPPDDLYNIISFSSVLHHLPEYKNVLLAARRSLCPGGVIWVCHEPLKPAPAPRTLLQGLLNKMLSILDGIYIYCLKAIVYLYKSLAERRLPKRIDYSWSDYHASSGLDADALVSLLLAEGGTLIHFEFYNSRFNGLVALLDEKAGVEEPRLFRFIIQAGPCA